MSWLMGIGGVGLLVIGYVGLLGWHCRRQAVHDQARRGWETEAEWVEDVERIGRERMRKDAQWTGSKLSG